MRHHFRRKQAMHMFNKGSLLYIHCGTLFWVFSASDTFRYVDIRNDEFLKEKHGISISRDARRSDDCFAEAQ
jgi:hypothetical protein